MTDRTTRDRDRGPDRDPRNRGQSVDRVSANQLDAWLGGPADGARHGAPPPRGLRSPAPTVPDPYRYTIADLEAETGVSARTVRYYVSQGLLPPAHGRGPSATYDLGHLLRLRVILLLKDRHMPLDEIKLKLGNLTDPDLQAMLGVVTRPPEDRWRRIELHPDLEFHVREHGQEPDLAMERAVDQIIDLARSIIDHLEHNR